MKYVLHNQLNEEVFIYVDGRFINNGRCWFNNDRSAFPKLLIGKHARLSQYINHKVYGLWVCDELVENFGSKAICYQLLTIHNYKEAGRIQDNWLSRLSVGMKFKYFI